MKKILCITSVLALILMMPFTAFADEIEEVPDIATAIYGLDTPEETFVPDYDPAVADSIMEYPEEIYGEGYDPTYQNGFITYDEYEGDSLNTDNSGNAYMTGKDASLIGATLFGGFGAGYNLTIENTVFDDCLALAGYAIDIENSYVSSSAFLAGSDITLENTVCGGNLFVAGKNINVDTYSSFTAVKVFGETIDFSGSADDITLTGDKVTFNGYASGDVTINANEVIIGTDAITEGKLTIVAEDEPDTMPENFAEYEYQEDEDDSRVNSPISATTLLVGAATTHRVFKGIRNFIMAFLFALLVFYLLPRVTNNGKELSKDRIGLVFGSGVITIIAAPIAVVILLITVIGIPAGLILGLIFALLKSLSIAFTACILSQLIFKEMKPVLAFLIGSAILGAATIVPGLCWIVKFGCYMFTVGTVLQLIWQGRKTRDENKDNSQNTKNQKKTETQYTYETK